MGSTTGTFKGIAGGLAAGAAGAYFLDPQQGKRRRHVAQDRVAAFFRRGAAEAQRKADYAAGEARGAAFEAVRPMQPERPAANDQALADRVRSEIFRPAEAPKDSVNVNVEEGVVYLRGEVKRPEDVRSLGEAAARVDGVRSVENLLHLPRTPAPTKA
jgi:osmotically-inducible protein OsmY